MLSLLGFLSNEVCACVRLVSFYKKMSVLLLIQLPTAASCSPLGIALSEYT